MSTRTQRIVKAMKAKRQASQLTLLEFPTWAEPRIKPPGWLTDPTTVHDPVQLGRPMTAKELSAYKEEILQGRRNAESERIKSAKTAPEHLNDQARLIRESMKRGHYKGGE